DISPPRAIGCVTSATTMPYMRITSPGFRSSSAILCLAGIASVTGHDEPPKRTSPPAVSGCSATTTLSRGSICNTNSGMGNQSFANAIRHGQNTTRGAAILDMMESQIGERMKAVLLQGPGQAAIAEAAEPAQPGDDDILLQVRRIGLCGSDLNSYRGRNPLVTYPRIPGHEIAATVAQLHEPHPDFKPGMAVTL